MTEFIERTGLNAVAVTVRGGPEAINNMVAGHIPISIMNASDVVEQAKAGRIHALAVTSPERISQLPETPTMIEAGYKDFVIVTWNGLAAPAGTPKPIVDRLSAAVHETLKAPKNRELFSALVVTPVGNTPEDFTAEIKADVKRWGDAVRSGSPSKLAN